MIAAFSQKSIGSQNPDFRQFYESAELTSALSALRNARTPVCSLSLLGQLFCLMSIEQPKVRKRRQQADTAASHNMDEFAQVLENLSYKECRFDHRSEPMSILCMKFRAAVGVLVELQQADDKNRPADVAWAKGLLRFISGADGFNKLVKFRVDCDFAVAAGLLIRLQGRSSADISLSVSG